MSVLSCLYLLDMHDESYSRGPVGIHVGEMSESNYYVKPAFKFEQVCLRLDFFGFLLMSSKKPWSYLMKAKKEGKLELKLSS